MADFVRRSGAGRFGGGDVVWSVAEGRKGRRWREVRTRDGAVVASLLLETDPQRGFAHMELSTSAGLLTLHPEADGSLHGNAVRADGIEHIDAVPWRGGSLFIVHGSPTSMAAAAWQLAGEAAESPVAERHAVMVDQNLHIRALTVPVQGLDRHPIDDDGLPVLDDGGAWPLEVEAS